MNGFSVLVCSILLLVWLYLAARVVTLGVLFAKKQFNNSQERKEERHGKAQK